MSSRTMLNSSPLFKLLPYKANPLQRDSIPTPHPSLSTHIPPTQWSTSKTSNNTRTSHSSSSPRVPQQYACPAPLSFLPTPQMIAQTNLNPASKRQKSQPATQSSHQVNPSFADPTKSPLPPTMPPLQKRRLPHKPRSHSKHTIPSAASC